MADVTISDDLTQGIQLGLECIAGKMRDDYFKALRSEFPDETPVIQSVEQCAKRSGKGARCLGRVLRGYGSRPESATVFTLPPVTKEICTEVVRLFIQYRHEESGFADFGHDISKFTLKDYRSQVPPAGQRAMKRFLNFFSTQFEIDLIRENRKTPLQIVREHLERQWRGIKQYNRPRSEGPIRLNPPLCPNDKDFERHDLDLVGVKHLIPVFRPADSIYPWTFLESDLKVIFEILKVFIRPKDLEEMLSPSNGKPPMSFYIVDPLTPKDAGKRPSVDALKICGIKTEDRDGQYDSTKNQIMIAAREGNLSSFGIEQSCDPENCLETSRWESVRENRTASIRLRDNLFHEIGHAIEYFFIGPEIQKAIRAYYEWTLEKVRREPTHFEFIPNYLDGIVMIGNVPWTDSEKKKTEESVKRYALTDSSQFFAEMVAEYMRGQISERRPYTAADQARDKIMKRFFSGEGINSSALAIENIEAAHRCQGILMDILPKLKIPAATKSLSPSVPISSSSQRDSEFRVSTMLSSNGDDRLSLYFSWRFSRENETGFRVGGFINAHFDGGAGMGIELAAQTPSSKLLRLELISHLESVSSNKGFLLLGAGMRLVVTPVYEIFPLHLSLGAMLLEPIGNDQTTEKIAEFGMGYAFY